MGRLDGGFRFATVMLISDSIVPLLQRPAISLRRLRTGASVPREDRLFHGLRRRRSFPRRPPRLLISDDRDAGAPRAGHHSSFGGMMNRRHYTLVDAPDDGERVISRGADKNRRAAKCATPYICVYIYIYSGVPLIAPAFHPRALLIN